MSEQLSCGPSTAYRAGAIQPLHPEASPPGGEPRRSPHEGVGQAHQTPVTAWMCASPLLIRKRYRHDLFFKGTFRALPEADCSLHGGWGRRQGGWQRCAGEPTLLPLSARDFCRWHNGPSLGCEPGGQTVQGPPCAPRGPGTGGPLHTGPDVSWSWNGARAQCPAAAVWRAVGQPLASLASVSLQFFPWTLRDPASCGPDITHRASLQAPGTSADPSGNREPYASALWPSSWVWPFVSPVEHEKALSDEMPSNLTLACANCASRMGAFLTSTVHASKAGSRPPDTTPSWQALGPPGPAALLPPISALVQTRPRGPQVGQRGGLGSLAAQTDHCWNPDPWVGLWGHLGGCS